MATIVDCEGLPALPETRPKATLALFKKYSQAILDEWEDRRLRETVRRAESPNAWFKREAYRLLAAYIELDRTEIFRRTMESDNRPNKLVQEAIKNPFKMGLLAMFADESPLSRNNRHVFGNQMLYAWVHRVPAVFLNAFLAVSGGPALIAEKLKARSCEPGFEENFHPERWPE